MKNSITILILLFSAPTVCLSQPLQTTSYCQLERETQTQSNTSIISQFTFSNNELNVKKSSQVLDSLIWFLSKQPNTIVNLMLLKENTQSLTTEVRSNNSKQIKQITKYLIDKGINSKRLSSLVSYCKEASLDSNVVSVKIGVVSRDFTDME